MIDAPDPNDPERDDVSVLLRLAGRRMPVASETTRRVRTASHAAWRVEVARRHRLRLAWLGLSGVAAASVVIGVWIARSRGPSAVDPSLASSRPAPRLEAQVGGVECAAARNGGAVPWGSEVTTDSTGLAALRMPSGRAVKIGSSSRVVLRGEGLVELVRGVLYVDSTPSSPPFAPITVRTPLGEVVETGTRFEVRYLDDALRVRLRDGRVDVKTSGGVHAIERGTEIGIAGDGTATRRAIATYGPEWDWTLRVTSVPAVDGEPVRSLLEWIARERGLELAFDDPETERFAGATRLHGSFDRLTADQALDAALAASGLSLRIVGGAMVVRRV